MSIERVRKYFGDLGIANKIKEFDVSSATVELAAQALGVEGARIAKSLSFMLDGSPILIIAAGDAKIDNSKYKHTFGQKAKMLLLSPYIPSFQLCYTVLKQSAEGRISASCRASASAA